MLRDSFQVLLRAIHISDETIENKGKLKIILQLTEIMQTNFKSVKVPGEFIVIDESQIAWRCRV